MHVGGRTLSSWQRLLLLLLAVGGFALTGYWAVVTESVDPPLDVTCASWDREASVGIALLVPDSTPIAEARLDDALYRLRRARKNCRAGWRDLARQDYADLRDAYPFPGRSVADVSSKGRRP